MPLKDPEVYYFTGKDGLIYFHVRSVNAEVLFRSSQGYATFEHAQEGFAAIRSVFTSADLTEKASPELLA